MLSVTSVKVVNVMDVSDPVVSCILYLWVLWLCRLSRPLLRSVSLFVVGDSEVITRHFIR